jgi:hypothetical protein
MAKKCFFLLIGKVHTFKYKYNRDAETYKQYFECNTCFAIPDEGENDALTFRPLSSISV